LKQITYSNRAARAGCAVNAARRADEVIE